MTYLLAGFTLSLSAGLLRAARDARVRREREREREQRKHERALMRAGKVK